MKFIHKWSDIGSKFLAEKLPDGEIIVYGELDIASGEWCPVTDAGEPNIPRNAKEMFFWDDKWERFNDSDLNLEVDDDTFNKILTTIQEYDDSKW